jgi:hypothetical protein
MSELDEIKTQIAETEKKLKEAEEEVKTSGDSTRRDRLESILLEQQKKENLLLVGSGNYVTSMSHRAVV